MVRPMRWVSIALIIACSGGSSPSEGTHVRMDYAAVATDFYAAPFPSETRRVDGVQLEGHELEAEGSVAWEQTP